MFIEELFNQEKEKFNIEDFSLLLSDINFLYNIFIVLCFVFINCIFEKPSIFSYNIESTQIDKLILKYIENINKVNKFSLYNSFKISVNLNKLMVISKLFKDTIKIQRNYKIIYKLANYICLLAGQIYKRNNFVEH